MTTSLPRRRANARRGARATERDIDQELARQRAEAAAKHREGIEQRKAEREAEKARKKYTADELEGAAFVQSDGMWGVVIRINQKTVTVRSQGIEALWRISTISDARWVDRNPK